MATQNTIKTNSSLPLPSTVTTTAKVMSASVPNFEKEINRFLANELGRTIQIGEGKCPNDLTIGSLIRIKDDCAITWLKGQTLMFLGWQRYYERNGDWEWISEWGWDNGATTHIRTSHQLWLAGSKIILLDIGQNIQERIRTGASSSSSSSTIKWVQSIGNSLNKEGRKTLVELTEEQIAFEEITEYRTEKLRQAADLDKLKKAWLDIALPRNGATGLLNLGYGKKIEGNGVPHFGSELFNKHKDKIISWINWNPKWSPSNIVLRNFNTSQQQEEFREDVRKWLVELEGNDLKNWKKWEGSK